MNINVYCFRHIILVLFLRLSRETNWKSNSYIRIYLPQNITQNTHFTKYTKLATLTNIILIVYKMLTNNDRIYAFIHVSYE